MAVPFYNGVIVKTVCAGRVTVFRHVPMGGSLFSEPYRRDGYRRPTIEFL